MSKQEIAMKILIPYVFHAHVIIALNIFSKTAYLNLQ